MILWLRTAIFFLGWFGVTGLLGVLFLPALLSRRATWYCARIWAKASLIWLYLCCDIQSRLEGELPPCDALIAAKHQSAWDTLMLWVQLKNPAFVLKRGLYYIPIFGWYLWRSGQIAINRKKGREAMPRIIRGAAKATAEGRCVVIFPEGTRVPVGEARPFHTGIARVSRSLGKPVTPVALNAGLFWPKHTMKKFPGVATLRVLPDMQACGEHQSEWLRELQSRVNAGTNALRG